MLPQQYCLRWKYHHSNLQTMFSQLLDRGCFCDVTLACEGQLIRAHRVVLCACSSFFDTVLTNYASERDPIIIMKDVTFADVKCLIEFMYKGEINVEHANLASLLKTADDLKIKGLAEVSWRDDEDGPPPPTAAAEFHSPTATHGHDMYNTRPEQQRAGSPSFMPPQRLPRERKLSSPKEAAHAQQSLPTLTPLPPTSSASMVAVAAAAAAAAAAASVASPVENYLGPKRKRGRPPLDDAYDVFNVRKLAQYGSHLDAHHHHQAYLEAQRQYNDEQQRLAVISPIPPPSSTSVAAAAAYHQHIQQQQQNKRMRLLQRQQLQQQQQHLHHHQLHNDADEIEHDDAQADPEWITSNLEVNVGGGGDNEPAIECDGETTTMKEQKSEMADDKEANRSSKIDARKRKERHSEECDKRHSRERSLTRKRLSAEERDDNNSNNEEREREERESRQHSAQNDLSDQSHDRKAANVEEEDEEKIKTVAAVPQPVEEMENVRQSKDKTGNTSVNTTTAATSGTHKRGNISGDQSAPLALAPPPSLHLPAHAYGKYAPEGYLLNEHGMLMTHDFVHAPTAAIPSTGATASSSSGAVAGVAGVAGAANGNEQDYVDIKMEEFDGTDLRLTTEEISMWQDVIKMDDYLAKGRRPQFWEEPFTRRVLDAIKNKRLEMKKAARILGVSYGTLYGRYREVYGCLKHPYSSSTFRPTQSNQLSVQPRFDMVWPSPKRDSGLMPGPLEIGKIRPKDLSELWARPQI